MVTLLDFWAPWCVPCKRMEPILDELESEFKEKLDIKKINVDESPAEASQYGVMGIPTYIIIKDGKEVGRKVGLTSKDELLKLIS